MFISAINTHPYIYIYIYISTLHLSFLTYVLLLPSLFCLTFPPFFLSLSHSFILSPFSLSLHQFLIIIFFHSLQFHPIFLPIIHSHLVFFKNTSHPGKNWPNSQGFCFHYRQHIYLQISPETLRQCACLLYLCDALHGESHVWHQL